MSNFLLRSQVGGSVMNKVDKIVDLINRVLQNMGDDKVKIENIEEIDAVRYYGDGSGLTGIATGTGGVINEGSTTIGADSNDDGTGEIALQTKGVTRVRVKNDGTLEAIGNADIGGDLNFSGGDRSIYNTSNNYLRFGTNNAERMRITNGGNVGIGTSSPATNLHVISNIKIGGASYPSYRYQSQLSSQIEWYMFTNGSDSIWRNQTDGTNAMTLTPIGNLNITGTLTEGSTARLKEDIQPVDDSLSTVLQLQPKRYHRKTTLEAEEQKEKDKRKREDIPKESGLIAEELIEIMPEAVTLDEDGEPAGIAYSMIIPVLAKAIQELNSEIETLKGEK